MLVGEQSRTVEVIVTSVHAHAHAGDVDRVPPYVCLEGHCGRGRWMGKRRLGRIVGTKELSEIGVLLVDQADDYGQHGGGQTERSSSKSFNFKWVASCCRPATML